VRPRIRLIDWKPGAPQALAPRLQAAGYEVAADRFGPADLAAMRSSPPAAIVIDLSRTPSHGRDVALALRQSKGTRQIPLVFVGGDAEKVAAIEALLPDAIYATPGRLAAAVKRAIARPPANPVVPASRLAGYSGTPLPKKLGIKPGSTVALVGAPDGFETTLGVQPEGAVLVRRASADSLTIWFVRTRAALEGGIAKMAPAGEGGGLWIAWPKRTSALAADVTETDVREVGLAAGLVDFKVCAIDETWSGLRFSKRVG
jgi:CheY-like chemotaxis protein